MSEPATIASTSYMPGTWFGIIGESATVLLPPSEKSRAGAIWALVDDGAGFDEVLDALVATGLSSLPGFVLISGDVTPDGGSVRRIRTLRRPGGHFHDLPARHGLLAVR